MIPPQGLTSRPSRPSIPSINMPASSNEPPSRRSSIPSSITASTPLLTPSTPRTSSRGERLAASLRRGYISTHVLHNRSRQSPLSEFLGLLAPERYLALPKKSTAAAKALTAVALKKGLKEVHRLETFRRSGSLRGGARAIREDVTDPHFGWFDAVSSSLLGEPFGEGINQHLNKLVNIKFGPNSDIVPRTAHLPREALTIEMTGGCDYTESVAPAAQHIRSKLANLPADSAVLDNLNGHAKNIHTAPSLGNPVPDKPPDTPMTDVLHVKSLHPITNNNINSSPLQTSPGVSITEVKRTPNVSALANGNSVPSVPNSSRLGVTVPLSAVPKSAPVVPSNPHTANTTPLVATDANLKIKGNGNIQVNPVLFVDDTSNIQFDIDFVHTHSQDTHLPATTVSNLTHGNMLTATQAEVEINHKSGSNCNAVAKDPNINHILAKPLRRADTPVGLPCNVKKNAPVTMLQELLEDLHNDTGPVANPADLKNRPTPKSQVVNIDADDEDDIAIHTPLAQLPAHPSKLKRSRKRKTSLLHEKQAVGEKRDRLRNSIVEAMQNDHPDPKKSKMARSSLPNTNGHRSLLKRRNSENQRKSENQRRSSRRLRRTSAPIVDSSGSEDNELNGDDEEFVLEGEGSGSFEPPREHRTAGLVHLPNSNGAPQDDVTPSLRPRRSELTAREATGERTTRPASIRNVEDVEIKEVQVVSTGKAKQTEKERATKSWDEEIKRIEKLFAANETGSPDVSSSEDDNDLDRNGGLPLVERLVNSYFQSGRCLLDGEAFDEHGEMMQFYKETRNEAQYAPDAVSPGTEFVLDSWKRNLPAKRVARFGKREELIDCNKVEPVPFVNERMQTEQSRVSTGSKGSNEASSVKSESSDEEEMGEDEEDRRMQAKAKAVKARELQNRVCGDLLSTMDGEARRRVLRWAEKDYSWFDDGADMMEIVGSRNLRPCSQCDEMDRNTQLRCEESILLKLWTNMTWRKVRRMRHRVRS